MKKRTDKRKSGEMENSTISVELSALQERSRMRKDTEALQCEQVRLLYSNLPISVITSAILALILVIVVASVVTPERLFGWSALIGSILLVRVFLFIAWKRYTSVDKQSNTQRWLFWFRIGAITTGIIWGVGGVLLSPSGDLAHKIYVSFVLAGLSAGAATTLSSDRISFFGFLSFVLVPQVIFLAAEGDKFSLGMSATDALFLMFMLSNAHKLNLQLEENFCLRQKAIENESRMYQMLEGSPIAALITDAESNQILFANSSYISLINSALDKVMGLTSDSYYAHPDIYTKIMKKLQKDKQVNNELVELHCHNKSSGDIKWVLASYFPVEYQYKPAILGWLYDITDRKLMEDKISHMAYHDMLTGLPNRSLIVDLLKQAIANAEQKNSKLALMFLDLDKFKPVNDQYGHQVGDLLLKAVAKRITGCLRENDLVARVGGDEFIILLPILKVEKYAVEIAEKIRHALNEPFHINGRNITISSSTGLAIYPDHAIEEQELIKRADIAMYYAKSEGRNCVKTYQKAMQV